jgi:hypothetical protein
MRAADTTVEHSAGVHQDGTDFSYFLEVQFGSEAKPLYMLMDTGASTSWVMGSGCSSVACATHDSFGPDDSSTYVDTGSEYSVRYGTGDVSGHMVTDSLAIADLRVTTDFGVANQTSDEFGRFPFDGILGLSVSPDSFMTAVGDTGLLEANVFGISVARAGDGTNDGEIVFGRPNEDRFEGEISYTAVTSSDSWAIAMDDVTVGGEPAGITGRTAYIDTGTTFAFGPPDQIASLFAMVPGASSADRMTYTIPCDSDVPVAFVFSGVNWTISSQDLISAPNAEGDCTANLFGVEVVRGAWLLGDVFLKNVYTVFDVDESRIGFASKATPTSTGSTSSSPTATTSTENSTGSNVVSPTSTGAPGMGLGVTPAEEGAPTPTGTAPTETQVGASQRLGVSIHRPIIGAIALAILAA